MFPAPWYGEHRESHRAEFNAPVREAIAEVMGLPVDNFRRGYMGGKTTAAQALFYQELLFHIYHQIRSLGFKAIYVLGGHGPSKLYMVLTGEVFER